MSFILSSSWKLSVRRDCEVPASPFNKEMRSPSINSPSFQNEAEKGYSHMMCKWTNAVKSVEVYVNLLSHLLIVWASLLIIAETLRHGLIKTHKIIFNTERP